MCVVLLYVDLLCYVCYVPDVCRSVHTVFCLITTIIVILFKENVNLFRPTSYDIVRHLSENITTKKLLFLTITVGTTVFFHHFLCSADNPVQFHKIYYRLFSDLTDFLHVNGIHPALTRSECDRKKFDAASLLLINNSQPRQWQARQRYWCHVRSHPGSEDSLQSRSSEYSQPLSSLP